MLPRAGVVVALLLFACIGCGGDERDEPGVTAAPGVTTPAAVPVRESAGFDVVDPRGAPVANVKAEFLSPEGPPVVADFSSERGRVAWPAADAAVESVRLSKSGWEALTVPLAEPRGRAGASAVTLRPTTLVTVHAVGNDDGPVEGVRISLALVSPQPPTARAPEGELSGVTDVTGSLRFEGIHEGRWRVSASASDCEPLRTSPEAHVTAGEPRDVRIRLRLIEHVVTTVTTRSGEHLAFAFVGPAAEFAGGAPWTAQVQSDGRLVVPERPSALPRRLAVMAYDGTRYIATLVAESDPPRFEVGDPLPERPDSDASLTGIVTTAGGKPLRAVVVAIEGTSVTVGSADPGYAGPRSVEAMTRPDGTFRMFDVPFRRATLIATLTTGTSLVRGPSSSQSSAVSVNVPTAGVGLVIERGAAIRGTLLDARGVAVVGAALEFERLAEDAEPSGGSASVVERVAWTSDGGAFAVEGLEPGRYRVRAPENSGAVWVDAVVVADGEPVTLRCAEKREIRCRVVDMQGRPVPGATVAAFVRGDHARSRSQTTDERGVALLCGLDPAGRYVVEAWIGDFCASVADPAAPGVVEYDAQVDVEPILRIRVTGPAGVAVGGRRVRVLRDPQVFVCSARTRPDGTFELLRPPAGRYEIRLDEGVDIEAATTSISFPETREAVLECTVKPKK